jgi:uncharacterized membrane protein
VILVHDEKRIKKNDPTFFRQKIPADLILVVVWLAACIVSVYLPLLNATPIRFVFAIPVILFIPGYCLVAAFFPKERDIEPAERVALSFGLSIAIVPLIGFGLNYTSWGIRLDPIVIALTVFTLVTVLIASYRRARLPLEEQYRVPFSAIGDSIQKGIFPGNKNRIDQILAFSLIVLVVISILSTIYVFTAPKQGELYTDFFLLGKNRTITEYPGVINTSENYPVYIGIMNHENRDTRYTIETWVLRTEFNNITNTSRILTMDPKDRLQLTLSNNETKIIPYNLSFKKSQYTRVEFLLFKEDVPGFDVAGSDRINASYRNLHLWVTIEDILNLENSNNILI